ncbi:unnamed protein product [Microthlaspi erraticum]|uniref:Uncharacterized protein n=1 Tax=Microthlaspi erraticum TaxID=1685480 RepID=A0A6D2IWX9_9BRAS|nr:unnamed protein product [Microthlaspi erraticum]
MNDNEGFRRCFEHIPMAALNCVVFSLIHPKLRAYETNPSKPFSRAFAYASVGYFFFQLLHAFARTVNPRSIVFVVISFIFGFSVIAIALAAIYFN